MLIYIFDSDYEVMKMLESLINSIPKHEAKCFTTHRQLVETAKQTPPKIVLVDVDSLNGTFAVKLIKKISPEIKIIILSREKEKALEYFKLQADGLLIKPFDEEELKEQLFRAKHPFLSKIKYGNERKISV